MKKLYSLLLATLLLAACNQKQNMANESLDMESLNTIDVEKLIEPFDLEMDISHLSLSDLYILRHAFAARQGFPFREAYLRGIYGTTTWYDSLTYVFDENSDNFDQKKLDDYNDSWRDTYYNAVKDEALHYTEEEQVFIDRVKAREAELLALNFKAGEGRRVLVSNILNARQMDSMPLALADHLGRNGFAIVPTEHQQLFHVYEKNDYHLFPSFVTTDIFLQLYHLYFDCMLRETEQLVLMPRLEKFCETAQAAVSTSSSEASLWLATYFDVARGLLNGKEPADATARQEYQQVMKSEDNFSQYLGYENAKFAYSLFRPRGHYTRNEVLKRYFRTMMWLQTVPFQTDRKQDMERACELARVLTHTPQLKETYQGLTGPMTFLMGQPDDVTVMQVAELMKQTTDLTQLTKLVDQLAERQTRIRPKFQRTSRNKVRLMPQRYQPDAEVLQEMVDYKSEPTTRPVPQGLDVMAAMGIGAAEQILQEEGQKWKDFAPTMKRMKSLMDSVDWQETIAKQWLSALKQVCIQPDEAPYFMATPEWQRKSLNAALSSWAELKHDAILYAKQPFGAECGGGGIPNPVLRGYVEPNIAFWQKAIDLLNNTEKVLEQLGMKDQRTIDMTTRIRELATLFRDISTKELQDQPLSDEENDQLQHIGAMFENVSLELLREGDQYLFEWSDIKGPEHSVALIADVYTANADNNPEKSILYAGTGQADEIYVIVELQGYLYLTRGAVLSYRELTRPVGEQRLNDEEWQKMLEKDPRLGVPQWMQPVVVPLKQAPKDNEEVFYSSGC